MCIETIRKKRKKSLLLHIYVAFVLSASLASSYASPIQQHVGQQSYQLQQQQQQRQTIVNINVKENSPPGTLVTNIVLPEAFFATTGTTPNSQLLFSITGGDGIGRFHVDHKGRVHTGTVLDYEIATKYYLTVTTVSRDAIEASWTTVINILILNDESDDVPILEKPFYRVQLYENSSVNLPLIQVRASLQYIPNAIQSPLEYTLLNHLKYFTIDKKTGIVSLKNRLISKNYTSYILDVRIDKVSATNQLVGLPARVPIIVDVLDTNDNEPEPVVAPWRCSAHSNIETNVPICTVPIKDADTGQNSEFTFSLADDETNEQIFRIDNRTGTIYRKNSSRQLAGNYDLWISVVDHGDPYLETTVQVIIKIINPKKVASSNISMFYDTEFTISEESEAGSTIALLNDIDGENILPHIVSGNGHGFFTMDNGALIIAKKPSTKTPKSNKLTIMSTDGFSRTYQNLTIVTSLLNRSIPNNFYYHNITVAESQTILANDSVTLIDVSTDAFDLKSAKFSIYSTSSEDAKNAFSVDECCGIVRLHRQLDHEMSKSIHIVVQITQSGYPTEYYRTFSSLTVKVLDSNDWRPSFLSMEYMVRVPETAPLLTSIIQLQAVDLDVGRNAELTYSIVSGNDKDLFGINATMGTLFVKRELQDLSLNKSPEFRLEVMAKDNGFPNQLNGTTLVNVIVTVPKYIPPKFSKEIYHLELKEDIRAESKLITLNASSEPNGQALYYTILEGNDDNTFILNGNNGDLVLLRVFDYEVKQHYELLISAEDSSPPNRALIERKTQAKCKVKITIFDVNDNKPIFKVSSYRGIVSRAAAVNDAILDLATRLPLKIAAYDLDAGANGSIEYGINIPSVREFLVIDQKTQTVNVTKPLYNLPNEVTFTIFAHDLGTPSLTSDSVATVTVQILSPPTEPPRFSTQSSTTVTSKMPVFQKTSTTNSPTIQSSTVIIQDTAASTDSSRINPPTYNNTDIIYNPKLHNDQSRPRGGFSVTNVDPIDSLNQASKPKDRHIPLAFGGSSYIRYIMTKPTFDHLGLRFKTYHKQFVLMYSNNSRGHYVLDVQDSFLRFRFDLTGEGGGSGLIQLRSITIDDGKWHNLTLERRGISYMLTVDAIYTASGAAPFAQVETSHEFEPVFEYYFGAEADLASDLGSSKAFRRNGFVGCLEDITIDNTKLMISTEGVHPADLRLVNIELGCEEIPTIPISRPHDSSDFDFPRQSFYIFFYSLAAVVMVILLSCLCCFCFCCCRRKPRTNKRRRKDEVLLRNHHHQLSSVNMEDSFTRSINSRHSLRVAHTHTPPIGRAHHSKYGAGDTVSLSAINERKHKPPMALPPIPMEDTRDEGEDNYENFATVTGVFGPGHPEFLNELRKLKPDYTRMSTRAPSTPKKQTSDSTMNSIVTTSDNTKPVKSPRPSKNNLASNPNVSERIRQSNANIPESLPPKNSRLNNNIIGSKNNLRESVASNLHNNNSSKNSNPNIVNNQMNNQRHRPILVNSHHHQQNDAQHFNSSDNHPSNTNEDPDYDSVDSELDSGESDSGSELPSETRFLTFTRNKKRKKDKLTNGSPRNSRHSKNCDNEIGADEDDDDDDTDNGRIDSADGNTEIQTQSHTASTNGNLDRHSNDTAIVNGGERGNHRDVVLDNEDSDEDESEEDDGEEGVYVINRELASDNRHPKENGRSESSSSSSSSSSDGNIEDEERKHLNGHNSNGRSSSNHDHGYRRHSQQPSQAMNGHHHNNHSVGRNSRGHASRINGNCTDRKESDDL